jgi:hypothetical protein
LGGRIGERIERTQEAGTGSGRNQRPQGAHTADERTAGTGSPHPPDPRKPQSKSCRFDSLLTVSGS